MEIHRRLLRSEHGNNSVRIFYEKILDLLGRSFPSREGTLQSGGTGNSQNSATIITANYKINNNKKITEIDNFYDAIYLFLSFGGKLGTGFSLCAVNW